jgi:hypothetical protein
MTTKSLWRRLLLPGVLAVVVPGIPVSWAITTTFTDNFGVAHDYLTQGVAGTIWDGLYTGAGSFPGGNVGSGPGTTLIADANITGAGRLTVQSSYTGWENTEDDGFFLFKNISGDFQMSVQVATPFSTTPYNFAGLLIRAAGPDGAPWNGAENSLSLMRFDEFGVGNFIRNTTNGQTVQLTQPSDSNYWLLIDRVNGTNFNFYSKALSSDPWQLIGVSPIARSDLSGLTLQVGIAQATFDAGPGQAQFENFTLVAVPEPAAAALFCGGLALGAILSLKRRGLRQEIPGSTDQRACRGGYR